MLGKRLSIAGFLVLVALLPFCLGCSQQGNGHVEENTGSAEDVSDKEKDKQLLTAVRAAVANNTKPAAIEKVVGLEAVINTTKQYHRLQLERKMDIARDADDEKNGKPLPDFKKAKEVVFWIRPVGDKCPGIVGIVWDERDEMTVFFGVLLDSN
jgi:hypothetical protein